MHKANVPALCNKTILLMPQCIEFIDCTLADSVLFTKQKYLWINYHCWNHEKRFWNKYIFKIWYNAILSWSGSGFWSLSLKHWFKVGELKGSKGLTGCHFIAGPHAHSHAYSFAPMHNIPNLYICMSTQMHWKPAKLPTESNQSLGMGTLELCGSNKQARQRLICENW